MARDSSTAGSTVVSAMLAGDTLPRLSRYARTRGEGASLTVRTS